MKRATTVTGWLLLGLLGGALAQGCGSSERPRRNPSTGANAGRAGGDGTITTVQPPGNGGGGGESEYDPLCGIPDTNFCVPDLETNSVCLEGVGGGGGRGAAGRSGGGGSGGSTGGSPASTGGTGTSTGGTGTSTGGTVSAAGAGGESGTEGSSEGGMSQGGVGAAAGESSSNGATSGQGGEATGSAGQVTLAGAGGEPGTGGTLALSGGTAGTSGRASDGRAGGSATTASVSCQVIESPNHKGVPLATCRPAGTGTEGSPCFSGADCAPRFACVGDGPGQCRAYCCSGPAQCQAFTGTHCAVERLVPEGKSTGVLDVPVCMPAVKCSLAEPHECADGGTCSCPKDSACMVVSDDGTTSCVPNADLGTGVAGDPCPCAWGHVCSQSNKCLKLCEVNVVGSCTTGRCQGSASLPAGWGTCVGTAPKDAGAP